jgi:hypothetical protein
MINTFIDCVRELESLSREFPESEMRLTGAGFYLAVLTAEQWERHYGPQDQVPSRGSLPPTNIQTCE